VGKCHVQGVAKKPLRNLPFLPLFPSVPSPLFLFFSFLFPSPRSRTPRMQLGGQGRKSNLVHFIYKICKLVVRILIIFLRINWPNSVQVLVNRKPGQKVHFLGRRHISMSRWISGARCRAQRTKLRNRCFWLPMRGHPVTSTDGTLTVNVHTPPQLYYHISVRRGARGAVFCDAVSMVRCFVMRTPGAVCVVRCFVTSHY